MKQISGTIFMLTLALLMGCVRLSSPRHQCVSGLGTLMVVVAVEDISAGTVLLPQHITVKAVADANGCFAMSQTNAVLGKTLSSDVKAMNPITTRMIKDTEPRPEPYR